MSKRSGTKCRLFGRMMRGLTLDELLTLRESLNVAIRQRRSERYPVVGDEIKYPADDMPGHRG